MARYKFSVGETVDFVPGAGDANIPYGKYKVQRQLPTEYREPQYRVKNLADGHERVVTESRLASRVAVLGS
jgi:hypothetical protein